MGSVIYESVFWLLVLTSLPAVYTFFKGLGALAVSWLYPKNHLELKVKKDGVESIVIVRDQEAKELVQAILGAYQNAKN